MVVVRVRPDECPTGMEEENHVVSTIVWNLCRCLVLLHHNSREHQGNDSEEDRFHHFLVTFERDDTKQKLQLQCTN